MPRGRKPIKTLGIHQFTDADIFHVAREYLASGHEKKIKDFLAELKTPSNNVPGEKQIWTLLRLAIKKDMIQLVPPNNRDFQAKIIKRFPLLKGDEVTVVDTVNRDSELVSQAAAEYVLQRINELCEVILTRPIGLGLGPGSATLDFCIHLSRKLRSSPPVRKLRLYAISSGCLPNSPQEAPVSFFNLFPPDLVAGRTGLFAELLVRAGDFDDVRTHVGVKEAFDAKGEIDIIVSSMGDFQDENDLLRRFLESAQGSKGNLPEHWRGNVQFRPYSQDAPIREDDDNFWRAVTLFELEELRTIAATRHKHVVLIARQNKVTGRTKHVALRPLLQQRKLKVFNHLVTDAETAYALLAAEPATGAEIVHTDTSVPVDPPKP